ncbi:2456_t:CDS:2, partial [Cetraspora pellucida]
DQKKELQELKTEYFFDSFKNKNSLNSYLSDSSMIIPKQVDDAEHDTEH